MKVQTVNKKLQLQSWTDQLIAFKRSGQTVKQWCQENSVARKTFYYRRKRIQEEILVAVESGNRMQIPEASSSLLPIKQPTTTTLKANSLKKQEKPVFAALSMPQVMSAAVTVRLDEISIDIQNGADDDLIEQVLGLLVRL